jgi:hypothetical protein
MHTQAQASGIPAYWTRFPSFFLYPFTLEPLMACCGLALLGAGAEWLFFPLNLVCGFFFVVGTVRYGFLVLERTARGHIDDRLVMFDSSHGGKYLPYKQIVVLMLGFTLAGFVARAAGANAAMVVLTLLALFWPANTMLLALSNDLGESITPGRLWHVASRIGMPYLGLCGCLFLLTVCGPMLLRLLGPRLPAALLVLVSGFVTAYFAVAMYRMMGYVLYQYHRELGIDVRVDFEAQSDHVSGRVSEDLHAARIAESLREGRHEEALDLARDALRETPHDPGAQARLHRMLVALPGQARALTEHAQDWLPQLLRANRGAQAVEVLEAVQARQPDFMPRQADDVLPLARAAFAAHHFETAARLLRGFDQRYPGHPDTPEVYLLGARLLIEFRRDEAQAERVLAALQSRFPQHPAAAEAEKLRQLIVRLRAIG